MKTFTSGFSIEKNRKTGAAPIWILKCPFVAGTLYLSDRAVTITGWDGGPTTKAWVARWGGIDEDMTDAMGSPQVSDFSLDLIIDPDEATDIHDLLWSEAVETLDCELYLWFEGLTASTDPPVLMWSGNIVDFERLNELLYSVRLIDESVKLDKYPGRVLSLADYANAHLDDVGKQLPIVYGSAVKSAAPRLYAGVQTTITEDLVATELDIDVTDATGFTVGSTVLLGTEEVIIRSISGNTLSVYRGCDGPGTGSFTNISAASKNWRAMCAAPNGDVYAAEYTSNGIYQQVGGVGAFTSIATIAVCRGMCAAPNGDVYASTVGGDIYMRSGGTGSFNALSQTSRSWMAMAAAPNGDIYCCVYSGDIYIRTGGVGNFMPLSQTSRNWWGMAAAPNGDIYCCCNGGDADIYKRTGGTGNFAALGQTARAWVAMDAMANGDVFAVAGYVYRQTAGAGNFIQHSSDTDATRLGMACAASGNIYTCHGTAVNIIDMQTGTAAVHSLGDKFQQTGVDWVFMFADHPVKSIDDAFIVDSEGVARKITSLCTTYTGQTGSELAGYEGKAVVTYEVDYTFGEDFLISGDGYQDDVSGTFTGSASSLIERPDQIFWHFLYTYASWAVADFVTDAAMPFDTDGYKFSMVLQERKQLKDWLAYMAFQCRCFFRYAAGRAHLVYRPDSLTSDKEITAAMIRMNSDFSTSTRITRSPLDEIVNKISLYYKRDWSKAAGREAYQEIVTVTNAASITAYGEKEKPDTFLFDFIRDDTMAADLAAFYLARYKDRKKKVQLDLFLDNSEIEFSDALAITPLSSLLCEVRKVNFQPGSGAEKKNDTIRLEMREY